MLVISNKSSLVFKEFLHENNIDFIETTNNPSLDTRIADHPDLSIFALNNENILVDKQVLDYYEDKLESKNVHAGESVSREYPYDCIYNVYKGSNFYIHNNITEKNIAYYLDNKSYKHLYVKQGYSRCSIVPMRDKILTSDYGIYKSLKDKIKVILLKQESIQLDGFDQGFLGGTCGFFDNTLIFNGNIEKLDSYEIIKNEADASKINLLYPKNCDLLDTGSILPV